MAQKLKPKYLIELAQITKNGKNIIVPLLLTTELGAQGIYLLSTAGVYAKAIAQIIYNGKPPKRGWVTDKQFEKLNLQ